MENFSRFSGNNDDFVWSDSDVRFLFILLDIYSWNDITSLIINKSKSQEGT